MEIGLAQLEKNFETYVELAEAGEMEGGDL